VRVVLVQIRVKKGFVGGGISQSVHARSRMLAEAGHQVTILSTFEDPSDTPPHPSVKLAHVPWGGRMPAFAAIWGDLRQGKRLAEWLEANPEHDVVDVQEANIAPPLFEVCERRRIPKVHTIRQTVLAGEVRYGPLKTGILKRLNLSAARRAQINIAVSGFIRDIYVTAGIPEAKIRTIYNALDIPTETHAPSQERQAPTFLWVGRMVTGKGLDVAVAAARKVLDQIPQARFLFLGSGLLLEEAKRQAGERLGRGIEFPGHVERQDEMLRHRLDADVFFFTTVHESFGRVLAEAMAVGLPSVVTDIPILRELMGDTGLYFKLNDPDELATRLIEMARNPDLRRDLGERARARCIGMLSWDSIREATIEAYQDAIELASGHAK
jgi:glycosyltransferase involved in cell wall biosynthesis